MYYNINCVQINELVYKNVVPYNFMVDSKSHGQEIPSLILAEYR